MTGRERELRRRIFEATVEASQAILERHGLTGPFWSLGQAADRGRPRT